MHGDASPPEGLTLRKRSRWLVRLVWLLGVALGAGVLTYVATHPDELPTTPGVVTAETPAGEAVFVGVFSAGSDFARELEVSGVQVYAEAPGPVSITPHVCAGGSVGVTTDPLPFCSDFGPTEGATFGPGDTVVLEVVGEVPGSVRIDRIRVAYRESFQWATQRAGRETVVTILGPGS